MVCRFVTSIVPSSDDFTDLKVKVFNDDSCPWGKFDQLEWPVQRFIGDFLFVESTWLSPQRAKVCVYYFVS